MGAEYKPLPDVVYLGDPPPVNAVGVVGFVFSILGFLTCGLLSPLGLVISLVGLSGRPRGFSTAGTILGLLGTAWLATVGYAMVMGILVAKSTVETGVQSLATIAAFDQGKSAIESYRRETGHLPDGIEGNKLVLDIRDGWERSCHYTLVDDDSYVLRSAGSDGELFTDDDVVSDAGYAGIRIHSDDHSFHFGPGEIQVDGDDERVRFGPSGIHVDSGDKNVIIDGGGIIVDDGEKRIEINPGRIQGNPAGEEAKLDGASIKVRDGDKRLSIELPTIQVTDEEDDD